MDLSTYKLATRKMIMSPDLSVNGRLFGGRLMAWLDEGLAMLAMEIMNTQNIVTKSVSEVNFLEPAFSGDILEIWGREVKRGKSSLTLHGVVLVKRETDKVIELVKICECSLVFVALNDKGQAQKWH